MKGKPSDSASKSSESQSESSESSEPSESSESAESSESGEQSQQGEQSEQGEQGEQSQSGDQQQNQPSKAQQRAASGSQSVEKAGEHMQQAGDQLQKESTEEAKTEQERAIDELEQAKRELQEALDQLRREQQEEIIRGMEQRFRGMLTRQQAINSTTQSLDEKGVDSWDRSDELTLAGLVEEQTDVAKEADEALLVLTEEGTTIVFPEVVEQLEEDMKTVAERLSNRATGPITQAIEDEIVVTLEELIEAMEKATPQSGSSGQGSGGGGGEQKRPPLLPPSAELKLLRSSQVRVKRMTDVTGEVIEQADKSTEMDNTDEIDRLADRQQELAEMARRMYEQSTGQ
jgi:hypothetical protein